MRWLVIAVFVLVVAGCETLEEPAPLPTRMQLPSETAAPANPSPSAPAIEPTALRPDEVRVLLPLEPIESTLAAGEVERWSFSAEAGDQVRIRSLSTAVSVGLTLLNPAGLSIATGVDALEITLGGGGTYLLDTRAITGEGSYQLGLTVVGQPPQPAPTFTLPPVVVGIATPTPAYAGLGRFVGELSDGTTLPAEFEPVDEAHVYTFSGIEGQYVRVRLNVINGDLKAVMTVYDPGAVAIAVDSESDNGNAILRNLRLPLDGEYSIQVAPNGQPGSYAIDLTVYDTPVAITPTYNLTPTATVATPVLTPTYPTAAPGERITIEQPVVGQIEHPGDIGMHSFALRAGDIVSIAVSAAADSSLIPRVELIDPDGAPVFTAVGNLSPTVREALISPFTALLDGPYTAIISGEGETTGRYTFSYGSGAVRAFVFKGPLRADRGEVSTIARPATGDIWHVTLNRGDLIIAGVTPLDGSIAPILEMTSARGELIGIDAESAGPRSPLISGVRAPETGLYYLRVRPQRADTIGQYQIIFRYLDLGGTSTPVPGTLPILVTDGTLSIDEYDFYPLQGHAGQRILIAVDPLEGSPIDPYAAVIGPDGRVLIEGDDSGGTLSAYFEAVLPEDGLYQVRINGYLSAGSYRLTVTEIFD